MSKFKKNKSFIVLGIIALIVISLWAISWKLIVVNIETWGDRGTFGDMFGAVNSLFSGLAFIGITYSIYLQVSALRKDHERRRKQATMEHIRTIRPIYKELQKMCELEFGADVITKDNLNRILSEPELRQVVRNYLATLEHLAVGVNTGIFDIFIVYRMMGTFLKRTHHRYTPYINKIQATENPKAYIELQNIINQINDIRKENPPELGNINWN